MASALSNLSAYDPDAVGDASDLRFGIVTADWNAHITHKMHKACVETLLKHGVKEDALKVLQVPGAFELPAGARLLAARFDADAIICIGCVIKGETAHNEYINQAVASGLTQLSIATGRPHIFGVLTPNDEQQALDRAGGRHGNKGVEAAVAAIRMARLRKDNSGVKGKIGF